jgi:hypothetical protein
MSKLLLTALLSLFLALPTYAQTESGGGIDAAPQTGNTPGAGTNPSAGSGSGTKSDAFGSCTESCNRSYDVCMNQQATDAGPGGNLRYRNGLADELIGSSSQCADDVKTCLNGCGG